MNKFSHLFNEDMTSLEAQTVLFTEMDGKTKDDREELHNAYATVVPAIVRRDLEEAANGWID